MKASALAVCVVLSCFACRGGELPPPELEATAASSGGASAEPGEAPGTTQEGAGETSAGAKAGAAGARAAGGGQANDNPAPLSPEECQAEPVELAEITAGRVRDGARVELAGLVATSQKFLVSAAKSGSCLWGAFAADRARAGAGSGLFLVSFGAPREPGSDDCSLATDGIPDDLAPGDALAARGTLESYVPAACSGVAPALQLRIDAACPLARSERGAAPEPATLELELATRLAAGDDAALLREWGGALVRLEGVSAARDAEDGDAVLPFGVVRLTETPLEVRSRLYYFDLSGAGPRDPQKAPSYPFPTAFQRVTGIVFLDYCSWVLAPRDRCADTSPASAGCDP